MINDKSMLTIMIIVFKIAVMSYRNCPKKSKTSGPKEPPHPFY